MSFSRIIEIEARDKAKPIFLWRVLFVSSSLLLLVCALYFFFIMPGQLDRAESRALTRASGEVASQNIAAQTSAKQRMLSRGTKREWVRKQRIAQVHKREVISALMRMGSETRSKVPRRKFAVVKNKSGVSSNPNWKFLQSQQNRFNRPSFRVD